jgi:hypothetical protein
MYSSYGKERKVLLKVTEADGHSQASKQGKEAFIELFSATN